MVEAGGRIEHARHVCDARQIGRIGGIYYQITRAIKSAHHGAPYPIAPLLYREYFSSISAIVKINPRKSARDADGVRACYSIVMRGVPGLASGGTAVAPAHGIVIPSASGGDGNRGARRGAGVVSFPGGDKWCGQWWSGFGNGGKNKKRKGYEKYRHAKIRCSSLEIHDTSITDLGV